MNKILKHGSRILIGSISLMILWMLSLQLSEMILPANLKVADVPESTFFIRFVSVCLINSSVLYLTISMGRWRGLRLSIVIFLLLFGIQYLLGMIEAIRFNDSLQMPISGIYSMLLSGFILSVLFSPVIVLISGRFKGTSVKPKEIFRITYTDFLWKTAILTIIVYPLLYFLAGYYIAWQSEAVRLFYTGTTDMKSFSEMMTLNFHNGLYFFQIFRGLLWVMLAIPMMYMLGGNFWRKGIIIGLLFALLMNSQHLLPNSYFPEEVTKIHFIETASSNFIWGFIISLLFQGTRKAVPNERSWHITLW